TLARLAGRATGAERDVPRRRVRTPLAGGRARPPAACLGPRPVAVLRPDIPRIGRVRLRGHRIDQRFTGWAVRNPRGDPQARGRRVPDRRARDVRERRHHYRALDRRGALARTGLHTANARALRCRRSAAAVAARRELHQQLADSGPPVVAGSPEVDAEVDGVAAGRHAVMGALRVRLLPLPAWTNGLGRVLRAPALVLVLWVCTLSIAIPPAIALNDAVAAHLG